MFIGSVPKPVAGKICELTQGFSEVYVGCSGSFRIEKSIKIQAPDKKVYSNDVSVLSCALGNHLLDKSLIDVTFSGDLEPLNQYREDSESLVAAICISTTLSNFAKKNAYAQAHYSHMMNNLASYVESEKEKVRKYCNFSIDGFYAEDFRKMIDRAQERGAMFLGFMPTYKAGYEKMYKYINEHISWQEPDYDIWDPSLTGGLIQELIDTDTNFAVYYDQKLETVDPSMVYYGGGRPVYLYTNINKTSVLRQEKTDAPFKYTPIDPGAITPDSKVDIINISTKQANFLKNVYLAKGIDHKSGMVNFAVLIDGMLAGAFILNQTTFGDKTKELYILSDFALSRSRRISKLIPMIATSRQIINLLNRKYFIDVQDIYTTAFTDKPVSMKYRGIFELVARKENFLNYKSKVREQTVQEIYREWYKKYAKSA